MPETFADQLLELGQTVVWFMLFLSAMLTLAIGGFKFSIWYLKFKKSEMSLKEKVFLKIQIPEESEIEPAAAEQMYSSMFGIKGGGGLLGTDEKDHITFEIVANNESIEFYAVAPKHLGGLVEKQINAAYPEAEVTQTEPWDLWKIDGHVAFSSLVLKKEDYLPLI